jgi:hypothetical protein
MNPRIIWNDPVIDVALTKRFGLSRIVRLNSGAPYTGYHIGFLHFRRWH